MGLVEYNYPNVPDQHGTYAREQKHRKDGERPCDACLEAGRLHAQRWRASETGQRRGKVYRLAQGRAKQRLVDMYPALYKALYAEEKAKAEREVAL